MANEPPKRRTAIVRFDIVSPDDEHISALMKALSVTLEVDGETWEQDDIPSGMGLIGGHNVLSFHHWSPTRED